MPSWEDVAEETERRKLSCPVCQGTEFDREEGRIDSRWGLTSHKLVLMICLNCRLVLQFSAGRGIFDFD
jgi:hypothetical protein